MRPMSLLIAFALAAAGGAAIGQTPPTPGDQSPTASSRFSFNKVEDGFLRLDGQTGQVSHCKLHGADWACETVADDRAALENEIGLLQDRVDNLTREVAALRDGSPPPRPPAALAPRPDAGPPLAMPSHEDMERARAAIENAWRRLVEMIAGLQKDLMRKG